MITDFKRRPMLGIASIMTGRISTSKLAVVGIALISILVVLALVLPIPLGMPGEILSISLRQALANPDWLSGYSYRISLNYTGQTGAGTDYQVLVKVGESAGASGEDFDLGSHCEDFPYDIRFTDNDGTTLLDPKLITLTGTSPNRLAIFRVEVRDSLESGTVPIYMYYGKASDTPASNGANTFPFYGKLGAQNYEWLTQTGEEFTEHGIIYKGNLFVPACDYTNSNGGVKKIDMGGAIQATYAASYYTQAAPILFESGGNDYMIIYDMKNRYIRRFALSSPNTPTHSVSYGDATHNLDIESMGWDTANSLIIVPVYVSGAWYVRAYNMADLSVAWTSTAKTLAYHVGSGDSPLVVGSYVYWLNLTDGVLYKIDTADGSTDDSVDLGDGGDWISYASPIYDATNSQIYAVSYAGSYVNKVSAVDPSDMSVVWTHTFAAGSGSDSSYITYTGFTTPSIKGSIGYADGKVIVALRENNADADQYYAKMWAISATAGTKVWADTDAYDEGEELGQAFLLTGDHVVATGLDYAYSATNYHKGHLYILDIDDGTQVHKAALPWGPMCGGVTQTYNGRVFICMEHGFVAAMKVGWGTAADSIHFGKNSYHNQYASTLTVDESLTFTARSTTITGWTEDGGTSIDAEGFGMRLKEHESHYGHVEKAASALTNFCVEGRIFLESAAIANLGYSWGPRICAYWDTNDWIGIGLGEWPASTLNYHYHNMKGGTLDSGYSGTPSAGTWYWFRIRVDASNIYEDYSTDYINWTTLRTQSREATWAGAASLIIVGKGYGDGSTYPNADLDNNFGTSGDEATIHFLDVWQRKYAATEPSFSAAGSEETLSAEITNAPNSNDFGVLEVNTTSNTAINYFTITNTGNCNVDVTIQGTDVTGGDDTWTLSDTATPGENIYGLYAGLDDADDLFDVIVKKTETYNTLVSNLAEDATQDWGLKIYMPTSLSGYDTQQMSGTITLVASASS